MKLSRTKCPYFMASRTRTTSAILKRQILKYFLPVSTEQEGSKLWLSLLESFPMRDRFSERL